MSQVVMDADADIILKEFKGPKSIGLFQYSVVLLGFDSPYYSFIVVVGRTLISSRKYLTLKQAVEAASDAG